MKRTLIKLLGAWLFLVTSVVTLLNFEHPVGRALVGMAWGEIVLWIVICGGLMYRFREPIREAVLKVRLQWQLKFVLFATVLALLEEAITTTMTNLAPLFGVKVGEAYITASTNYLDVVFFHSVINFVGPFAFWALALKRYDFSPFAVFLIFGFSGVVAEDIRENIIGFAFWVFVYGLMTFLPAYSIPPAEFRGARRPKFHHYILMVVVPFLFVPLFGWIPHVVDPDHPQPVHFPPLQVE